MEQTGINNGGENVVRGSYSYVGPDGVTYTVNYIADRNGYRAYGAHLPQQPDELSSIADRRYFTTRNPNYYASTLRPSYINATPNSLPFLSHSTQLPVSTTAHPFNTVYIASTPKTFVNNVPRIYQYPSSTFAPIVRNYGFYSTTAIPFYSSTTEKIFGK